MCNTFTVFLLEMWSFFFWKENVLVQNTFLDVQFHLPIPVQIVTFFYFWATLYQL